MMACTNSWSTIAFATLVVFALIQARKAFSLAADWLIYLLYIRPFFQRKDKKEMQEDLQVIICGLPRTGTASMMQAMEILGFPCFHGAHLIKPTGVDGFIKAMDSGKSKDWKTLLYGFGAIADFPGACAYKKLMEVFPNAKVILTVRDAHQWYASFSQTVLMASHGYNRWVYRILQPRLHKCMETYFYNIILRGKPTDREFSVESFNKHIQDVKRFVDPHRLLIYEVGKDDGWTSLCNFLDVSHPNVPFPSTNERNSYKIFLEKTRKIRYAVTISYITFFSLAIGILLTYMLM